MGNVFSDLCSTQPRGGGDGMMERPMGGMPGDEYGDEGMLEPVPPPASPSWKLPQFPAPALPPLTRANKLVIACSRYIDDEEEKARTKRQVLNGQGEALSVVFDDPQAAEVFVPEVKKLFSLALSLTSLEIHTAALEDEAAFLQGFLDTLPSHAELKAFSLVTARDAQVTFSAISGLLYRNPGLQALRLWGPDMTMAGGNQYYPTCKLLRVDISHCKLFPQQIDNLLGGSKESLLCLKFDKNVGLSGTHIAKAVNTFGQNVQMLSILLPAESESEMDQKASYLVADTASRFPNSLKFLHCAGLAASDNLFSVTPSMEGVQRGQPSKTHLSSLVALRLDNCPRVSVNGLFAAIRQKSLPQCVRIHAFWLENEEQATDVELWKAFAAGEDIRIDLETPGLVHVTALKESSAAPPPDARDPSRTLVMPVMPLRPMPVAVPHARLMAAGQQLLRAPSNPSVMRSRSGSGNGSDRERRRNRDSREKERRRYPKDSKPRGRSHRRSRDSDESYESSDDDYSSESYSDSDSDDSEGSDYYASSSRRRDHRSREKKSRRRYKR